MLNVKLIRLLESVLGKSKTTNKGNVAFYCPFCQATKKKLEVQTIPSEKGETPWHCWRCNKSGKKIATLFKTLKVSREKLTHLYDLTNSHSNYSTRSIDSIRENMAALELPAEFKPLYKFSDSIEYKNALFYLTNKRKVSLSEIVKYNIGYCESGEYSHKIIIPSYDAMGHINYFVARSYYDHTTFRYKNPDASKNIIPFELFINWNLPIILCEGVFDAIAIKRNAIPLLGKTISESLKIKIITENVRDIYIALDQDAQKQAIEHAEYFVNNGKNVYFVNLHEKDPAEIGFEKMNELLKSAGKLSDLDLLKMRLQF